ncbi:MAG: lipid-A-disaccharide synthase, partial [Rhodospirillales bacterium]|nr:lipid-A-disaccharide synthase [Rhodospirillales bacterium]
AWRPGRAKKIARTFDRLLALLPFEPPYFEREGLTCDFVGHSVIEDVMDVEEARKRRNDFRKAHGIAADGPLLVVLPGSRKSEVDRMLAIFLEAANQASRRIPGLHVVVPTLPQIEERVRGGVQGAKIPITVVATHDEKLSAFAAADGALAASGTVSLELAAAQVPTLIAYKLNPISAWIGRRVIQVPWITLTNIILNQPLIPEEIQENCRPDRLAEGIYSLLKDEKMRAEQRLGSNEVLRKLGLGDDRQPSYRAARAVISVIASRS